MRTIEQAARAAAIGKDNKLWEDCTEIARARNFIQDPKLSNTQMCEKALNFMDEVKRQTHLRRDP